MKTLILLHCRNTVIHGCLFVAIDLQEQGDGRKGNVLPQLSVQLVFRIR